MWISRVGIEERPEEPETLQVVEVEMAEQDVQLVALSHFHRNAERPYPGSCIEDQDLSAGQPHFDTRRVAAVFEGIRAGRRD